MDAAHKRFLAEQFIGAIMINFVLNAAIGWFIFRGADVAPFFALTSIAGDTVAMGFLLPFIMCIAVSKDTHKKMVKGRFPHSPYFVENFSLIQRLPETLYKRAFLLGVSGLLFVMPILLVMHFLLQIESLPLWTFVWFKGTLAAIMAAPLALLVVPRAFADQPA